MKLYIERDSVRVHQPM